jgi:hypothetical protein
MTINYPNNIGDHQTVIKLREMIDHANGLKTSVEANAKTAQKTASDLAALPPIPSNTDINLQIWNWATSTSTSLPSTFLQVLNTALKGFGFTVPHPPPAPTGALVPSASAIARTAEPKIRFVSGFRATVPMMETRDAGFMYYVIDYAHLALWTGTAWALVDGGGGYYVDSELDLGIGYQVCDGSTTDYLLNNTPNLAVAEFTTHRHRSLRRGQQRFFRR